MSADLATLQHGVTVVLYLGAAVTAGATMATMWLAHANSRWAGLRTPVLRRYALGGALVALVASIAVLWLESAAMAEVPLAEAAPAVSSMLGATHYGWAWSIGSAALAVAVALAFLIMPSRRRSGAIATTGALAVFWYTRSMVSHAASEGDLSLPLLADWAHLALISLWVGEVIVAGLVVLAGNRSLQEEDRRDRAAYVAALSTSATFGLGGIFVTGGISAWHNLGSLANLLGTPYGNTLLAKLALVGLAALLGGFNRFVVMLPWLACENAGRPPVATLPLRFRLVLQIEAFILIAALSLAVILAATSPPGTDM